MQLQLGGKIRELRRRDGRTQEALAHALGVTSQAVSRWEASGSYPDMELIPAIANYFGVSIDELFGYQGERESRIDALLAKVDELDRQNGGRMLPWTSAFTFSGTAWRSSRATRELPFVWRRFSRKPAGFGTGRRA